MNRLTKYAPYLAWAVAALSTAGSLFFSDILHYVPCALCWWGRIFMYPLVIIIGIGILRRERHWIPYALPLTLAGTGLALYHSLLQWGIIPEIIKPCVISVPCTTKYINLLGFITIPFLELLAFLTIAVCLYLYNKETTRVP